MSSASSGSGTSPGSVNGFLVGLGILIAIIIVIKIVSFFGDRKTISESQTSSGVSQAPSAGQMQQLGKVVAAEAYIPLGMKVDIAVSNVPTLPVRMYKSQTLRIWGQKGVLIHVKYMGDEKVYVEDTGTYLGPPQGKLYDTVSWSGSGAIPVCVFLRSRPVPDSCKTTAER